MVFNLERQNGRPSGQAEDKDKKHAGQNNNATKAQAARVAKVSQPDALEAKVTLTGKFSACAWSLPVFFGRRWATSAWVKPDAPILALHSDASQIAPTPSSISLTLTESDPGNSSDFFHLRFGSWPQRRTLNYSTLLLRRQ